MKFPLCVRVSLVVVLGVCSAASGSHRSTQVTDLPTFRSQAELVLVPVIVQDESGKHISGLKQQEFSVKEGGRQQVIAVFEEIKAPGSSVQANPGPNSKQQRSTPAEYSNAPLAPERPLLIIALDRINSDLLDQTTARERLAKFLVEKVPPDTPVSLVTIDRDGIHVLHDFTRGAAALAETLKRLQSKGQVADPVLSTPPDAGPVPSEPEARFKAFMKMTAVMDSFDHIRTTLDALEQLAHAYAGVSGRKALLWATGGWPFQPADRDDPQLRGANQNYGSPSPVPTLADVLPRYQHTWKALADANIALYPVDVRGLTNASSVGADVSSRSIMEGERQGYTIADAQRYEFRETAATMRTFADATGGRAFLNTNDIESSFDRAMQDSSSYYLLGFYLPAHTKPGWHPLSVTVSRPGEVRARNGFFVPDPSTRTKASKENIGLALGSPLDFTDIPITVRPADNAAPGGDKHARNFLIVLPAGALQIDEADQNHVSLHLLVVARKEGSDPAVQLDQKLEARLKPASAAEVRARGFSYPYSLKLLPGEYSVRFIVQDNLSGNTGSLTVPVHVGSQ